METNHNISVNPSQETPFMPLSSQEWATHFTGLWPQHEAYIAYLKMHFFEPIGKTQDAIFAIWLTGKDKGHCPVVRFCLQTNRVCMTSMPMGCNFVSKSKPITSTYICNRQ